MTPTASSSSFEANLDAFYDRIREIRPQPPQQTLAQLQALLLGEAATDGILAVIWQRLVSSPCFAQQAVNFFNRCCYSLINYWTTQSGAKTARIGLVQLFKEMAKTPSGATLPWFPHLLRFSQSPQFEILEELIKVDDPQTRPDRAKPEDKAQKPLKELIHHYPFLYESYFTRYNPGEEGRRAMQLLQERREKQFDRRLLKCTRQLGQVNPSRANQPSSDPIFENPTLLSRCELSTAIHEFAGLSPSGHCYEATAEASILRIARLSSNREMKGEIHRYLVDGLTSYSQRRGDRAPGAECGSAGYGSAEHHVGHWLGAHLQAMRVEFDDRRPHNPQSLVYACGGLLNVILADPTLQTQSGRRNHAHFLNMTGNLGETFTIGLVLKLLMLCRSYKQNLKALRHLVAKRFVQLFEHYESGAGSGAGADLSWLVKCLDNYMVASSIHFGDTTPSMWRQLLTHSGSQRLRLATA